MAEYAMESVIRGHHVYKTIWQPRLGPSSTLIPRDLAGQLLPFRSIMTLTPGTDVRALRTFVRGMRLTNVW